MSTIESEAYFDGRMITIGLSVLVMAAMRTQGWLTLGDFAFSSAYIPGQGPDTAFVTSVLEVLVGANHATSADSAKLRRLYFEAHTLSIADLRRRTERTDSDMPLKLPAEERVVRLARMKTRLPGFDISGVFEPSHSLVDSLTQMLETSQLKYVPWTTCTAREQEVLGVKKVSIDQSNIVTDPSGFLRKQSKAEDYKADVTTDLLLTHALARRAFAFELANVCTYETFAELTTKLMKEFMRPPLARYNKVSLEQIENADRHVFVELAADTAGGLARRPDGSYPVAVSMTRIINSPEFLFLLMQMPAASGSSHTVKDTSGAKGSGKNRGTSRSRSRRRKVTETQEKNAARNAAGKGRGKGKQGKAGKGSKGKGSPPFNAATEVGRTADGLPICYAFNTNGCKEASPGDRCSKGFHVCWKIGCGLSHSSHQHA